MFLKGLHLLSKSTLLLLEWVLILLFLLMIGFGAILWTFSKGPVDVTWAQNMLSRSISTNQQDLKFSAEKIMATWPKFTGPLQLDLTNIRLQEGSEDKLQIKKLGLEIAKAPLFIGHIAPVSVFIMEPSLRVKRSQDGRFSFLLDPQTASSNTPPSTSLPTREFSSLSDIGNSFFLGGRFLQDDSLAWLSELQTIRILEADVIAEDNISGVTWRLPDMSFTLERGKNRFALDLQFTPMGSDQKSQTKLVLTRTADKQIQIETSLSRLDLGLLSRNFTALSLFEGTSFPVSGSVQSLLDKDWNLLSANGTIAASHLEGDNSFFAIRSNRVVTNESVTIPVSISLKEITSAQIAALYPDTLSHLGVSSWIEDHLREGIYKNIIVTLPFVAKKESGLHNFTLGNMTGSFDFENLTVDYRAPLIPVTKSSGQGKIENDLLTIEVNSGFVGDLNIQSGQVEITKLTQKDPGMATVSVNLQGPIREALNYISKEPISLSEQVGLDPATTQGDATIQAVVQFPTLKELPADLVEVDVKARLENARLPKIVQGLDLVGGPLNILVDGGLLKIEGQSNLENRLVNLVYEEYLAGENAPFYSRVTASVVTDENLRQKFGVNLSNFMAGDIPAKITYLEKTKGEVTIDIEADLTAAQAFVPALDYLKPAGQTASATAKAYLKNGQITHIDSLNLQLGSNEATEGVLKFGRVGSDWDVASGSFARIDLGQFQNVKLSFTQPKNNQLNFNLTADQLDARPFLSKRKNVFPPSATSGTAPSVTLDARTRAIRTGRDLSQKISSASVQANIDGSGLIRRLDLSAKTGTDDFQLSLKPNAQNRMELSLLANNAGETLRVFDIYENMRGGVLQANALQTENGKLNDLQGSARIDNFRVVNAPILATLINSFGLVGLDQLLKNEGIIFTKLKTDFIWHDVKGQRILNFYEGKTAGASVGLTFGGIVNQTQERLDITGTIVPVAEVNKVVSQIPIVGKLLTGGKDGGIIAATYTLKGPSEKPQVMINPLSVLAPGFLRSILFEGGMDSGRDEKPSGPTQESSQDKKFNP
jgi:hypothetical protein